MQKEWRLLVGLMGIFILFFIAALWHAALPNNFDRTATLAALSGLSGPAFSVQSGDTRQLSSHRAGLRPYPALPESSTLGFVLKGRE